MRWEMCSPRLHSIIICQLTGGKALHDSPVRTADRSFSYGHIFSGIIMKQTTEFWPWLGKKKIILAEYKPAITRQKMSAKVIFSWSSIAEKWDSAQSCKDHGIHHRPVSVAAQLWEFDPQHGHRQKYKIGLELKKYGSSPECVWADLVFFCIFSARYINNRSN